MHVDIFVEDDLSAFSFFFQFDSFNFFSVMDSALLSFELCNVDYSFDDGMRVLEWREMRVARKENEECTVDLMPGVNQR